MAKPWYFLFLPSYWKSLCGVTASQPVLRGNGEKVHTEEDGVEMVASGEASKEGSVPVEDVTSNMRQQVLDNECVHLSGLTKVFDTNTGQKVAVDGLDMTFYSGQITALLGHNGWLIVMTKCYVTLGDLSVALYYSYRCGKINSCCNAQWSFPAQWGHGVHCWL